ncbi:MAG: hypothetical protein PWP27_1565 [Clostridiales bacterium]|jgi:hypothetical protein|nr:hypothetical protein [Clostridiales bacterium]MDK2933755.1 hypothetical protein [Clostridiales bacterium]
MQRIYAVFGVLLILNISACASIPKKQFKSQLRMELTNTAPSIGIELFTQDNSNKTVTEAVLERKD